MPLTVAPEVGLASATVGAVSVVHHGDGDRGLGSRLAPGRVARHRGERVRAIAGRQRRPGDFIGRARYRRAPSAAPSSRNCTLVTPMSSTAVAVTVIAPSRMAPADGLANITVGAARSFRTVTITAVAVVSRPAPSRATAVNVCRAVRRHSWSTTPLDKAPRSLIAERRTVEQELNAGDADVIRCGRGDRHVPSTVAPAAGAPRPRSAPPYRSRP